jgi:hypothetical protein
LIIFYFYFRKKFGRKIIGRQDDADTDSHSDSDFDGVEKEDPATAGMSAEDKLRAELGNLEILEKRLVNLYFNFELFFIFKIILVWDDLTVMFIICKNGKLWFMLYKDEILLDLISIHMYAFKLMMKNDIQQFIDVPIHHSLEK